MPLFGAIAATAKLPPQIAQAIMPGRSVLYESGAITVYYRVDAEQRLLIGGRGPMREVDAVEDDSAPACVCAQALAASRRASNGRTRGAGGLR